MVHGPWGIEANRHKVVNVIGLFWHELGLFTSYSMPIFWEFLYLDL